MQVPATLYMTYSKPKQQNCYCQDIRETLLRETQECAGRQSQAESEVFGES